MQFLRRTPLWLNTISEGRCSVNQTLCKVLNRRCGAIQILLKYEINMDDQAPRLEKTFLLSSMEHDFFSCS